jgi:hypothetical protein
VCSFALAPLLALAVPAAADSSSGTTDPTATTVAAPSTDPPTYVAQDTTPSSDPNATDPTTVDTTPSTDPPTSVDTTPSTDPPTTVDTTPPTDPPTTAAPPVTSPPPTVDTTPVTAPPDTTPSTTPQVVVPPAGSSGSSGGSSGLSEPSLSGTGQTDTADVAAAAPKPAAAKPKAKSSGGVLPAVGDMLGSLQQAILITNPNNNDTFTATIAPINAHQAIGPAGRAVESLSAELQQALNPHTDGPWGLGSSAPRLLPWVVLLGVAWLVRMVAAAVLADRTAGPRRRRWTHL